MGVRSGASETRKERTEWQINLHLASYWWPVVCQNSILGEKISLHFLLTEPSSGFLHGFYLLSR